MNLVLFNPSESINQGEWYIVDDRVMGGISLGEFHIQENGPLVYHGNVSTKNNGGFSSLRWAPGSIDVSGFSRIIFEVKGDGKEYQFRIKNDPSREHAYVKRITTTGKTEKIIIELNEFYPSYRGRKLDIPNFNAGIIEEMGILIANKTEESFSIEIHSISLE